jgi:hypothetical protein
VRYMLSLWCVSKLGEYYESDVWLQYHSLVLDERESVDKLGSNGQRVITKSGRWCRKWERTLTPLPQFVDLKKLCWARPQETFDTLCPLTRAMEVIARTRLMQIVVLAVTFY